MSYIEDDLPYEEGLEDWDEDWFEDEDELWWDDEYE